MNVFPINTNGLSYAWTPKSFLFYCLLFLLALPSAYTQVDGTINLAKPVADCPLPCPCEGSFLEMQVYYFGADNVTIQVYRTAGLSQLITTFNNVMSGDLLVIDGTSMPGGSLASKTFFHVSDGLGSACVQEIYSRCPPNAWPGSGDDLNVLGQTYGDFVVFSRTDEGTNAPCDLSNVAQDWHVGGNVVGATNNTLGTRNNENVVFITNDQDRGTVTTSGDFGINTLSPSARLDVQGNALIDETLDVNGITRLHDATGSTMPVNGALVVTGGAGIGENMNVGQDTRTNRDLVAGRDAAIGRNLDVNDDATIGQALSVGTNATVGQNLSVTDNANIGQNLVVDNDASIGNDLDVDRDLTNGRDLSVGQDATIGDNLQVGGNTNVDLNLSVTGTSSLNGFTQINDNARITQNLDVDGDITIGFGNTKHLIDNGSNFLIENQSGNVVIEADDEEMIIVSNTQVEVKKRLIVTGGADLAERFVVNAPNEEAPIEVLPGMVLSIDREQAGQLTLSQNAHDRAVAGIVSGAGNVETAMVFGQTGTIADGDVTVAISGRVYAYVDASYGTIEPGDLLTTSPTTGHAMKVTDYNAARGAIIGKAMTGLKEGKGLVLVLISLQ